VSNSDTTNRWPAKTAAITAARAAKIARVQAAFEAARQGRGLFGTKMEPAMPDNPTTAPRLDYQPAPCPRCGAATEDDAAALCRPTGDTCPAEMEDVEGRFLFPTAASIEAMDAWAMAQIEREQPA
jgi:hypothetical protein